MSVSTATIDSSGRDLEAGGDRARHTHGAASVPSTSTVPAAAAAAETESVKMSPSSSPLVRPKIDAERHRFPHCIVWTPLPMIT